MNHHEQLRVMRGNAVGGMNEWTRNWLRSSAKANGVNSQSILGLLERYIEQDDYDAAVGLIWDASEDTLEET